MGSQPGIFNPSEGLRIVWLFSATCFFYVEVRRSMRSLLLFSYLFSKFYTLISKIFSARFARRFFTHNVFLFSSSMIELFFSITNVLAFLIGFLQCLSRQVSFCWQGLRYFLEVSDSRELRNDQMCLF